MRGDSKQENAMSAAIPLCPDSDRERWLELRLEGIGASDAPAVLGRSSFMGPFEVAAVKLGYESDREVTELMDWGHYVEAPMLKKFHEETGFAAGIDGMLYRSSNPKLAFMQATIDGQTQVDGEVGGIECKLAFWSADAWDDGVPDQVQIQVQHQMAVMEWRFTYVLALLGGYRFRWSRVERDDRFIADELIPAERDFWERVQDGRDVVPKGAPDREYEAIRAKFPDVIAGKIFRLEGDAWIDNFEKWRTCSSQKSIMEKAAKGHRNEFMAAIGDAEFAVLDDGQKLSLKAQTRAAHQVKESSFRVLRPMK
jgi:putative phage-type endonuclease